MPSITLNMNKDELTVLKQVLFAYVDRHFADEVADAARHRIQKGIPVDEGFLDKMRHRKAVLDSLRDKLEELSQDRGGEAAG